jgi:hypothetical protein
MDIRGVLVAVIAVTACACASTPSPERGPQTAFYVVGDHASVVDVSVEPGAMPEGEFSVVKRVYWFFAGR